MYNRYTVGGETKLTFKRWSYGLHITFYADYPVSQLELELNMGYFPLKGALADFHVSLTEV